MVRADIEVGISLCCSVCANVEVDGSKQRAEVEVRRKRAEVLLMKFGAAELNVVLLKMRFIAK